VRHPGFVRGAPGPREIKLVWAAAIAAGVAALFLSGAV